MKEEIIDVADEENILNMWEPCEFKIDENYKYESDNELFNIFSDFIYYLIAFPVLTIITKLVYDLKIEGKENFDKVEGGAISISNHVLPLDCAMIGLAWGKRKIVFTTQEESFKIPFVRKLIKVLNAIPIPKGIKNRKYFIKHINKILNRGEVVHFYPEAYLSPYCRRIRNFKNGAFDFAKKNNVPIVPCVFKFRNPEGIRKLFKKKLDVTLRILEPIKMNLDEKNLEDWKLEIQKNMQEAI